MQSHCTQHLYIEVAHLHDALGAFAYYRKGLGQQVIQSFTLGNPILELLGLGA